MFELIYHSRIQLSQGQIFWREIGQGPNLVFLHGSWQHSAQWISMIEHLYSDYRCFMPDLLGCGESGSPKLHYSIDVAVEALAEYLNSLQLDVVYLVGHSLGAWIAASFALKYPERVRRLILISPEGVQVPDQKRRWNWMRGLAKPPALLYLGLKLLYPLAKLVGQGQKVRQNLRFRQQMLTYPGTCKLLFRRRWAEYQAELLDEKLPDLQLPLLILQGTHDSQIALSLSQAYAGLAPRAEYNEVKPGSHNLPEEAPDEVAESIREFLRQDYMISI